jgi:hypothetical protein
LRALAPIVLRQHMWLGQQLAEDHYSKADRKRYFRRLIRSRFTRLAMGLRQRQNARIWHISAN